MKGRDGRPALDENRTISEIRLQMSTPPSKSNACPKPFIEPTHTRTSLTPSLWTKSELFVGQLISFLISSFLLVIVVAWAGIDRLFHSIPRLWRPRTRQKYDWDDAMRKGREKVSTEVNLYAREVGLDIEDETALTEDGFYLRMHRVINPNHKVDENGRGPFPILITHGLFQSSGCFITSEERSLAFWLSAQGYQVFMGNNRGVFDMGHREYDQTDPRFWDWTIREIALYDVPAMIDHVRQTTGYDKIGLIAHSQSAGATLIAMSKGMRPEIGDKLSTFIALAPAVYAGPLTDGWLFRTLGRLNWTWWCRIFGVLDFIPTMTLAYKYLPSATVFGAFGYTMFAFLFKWTDTNWLVRRKTKQFRFTPTPVSSASLYWWTGKDGFAQRRCTMDESFPQWFDERFPPLAIYYGGKDYLVNVEKLLARLSTKEKAVKVVRVEKLDLAEHCDFYYAADAVEWCFSSFVDVIEQTRPRIPT
ncbi:hypothetical protein FRC03_010370 [Tulasnella sp. 419]|nr:hypothetical protein FRC03_010370 [Tulasnella sp. 419]